jgi:hypothetical protein
MGQLGFQVLPCAEAFRDLALREYAGGNEGVALVFSLVLIALFHHS